MAFFWGIGMIPQDAGLMVMLLFLKTLSSPAANDHLHAHPQSHRTATAYSHLHIQPTQTLTNTSAIFLNPVTDMRFSADDVAALETRREP